jgi:hypothetical protein
MRSVIMKKRFTRASLASPTAIVIYLMAAGFLFHLLAPGRQYSLFFDEYYYYSMSEHLAPGYLDAPPVTGLLMALSRLLLGDSVLAMRVFPALAGSFTMLFAALTARKMGGGRFAQALTAAAVMLAPMFMTFSAMFTYDAFDQLMSAVVVFLAARVALGEAAPRVWVLLGLAAGVGLMVKVTMGFLLVCLVAGMLLTRARKYLAGRWFWISAGIAAACCAPFAAWQAARGFPIFEYLLAYRGARTFNPSAFDLLRFVFVTMNPAAVLLWLGGLALLFTKRGRAFRPFAWAFLAYFALAAALSVKFYALAGALLPLSAFGAVCLERNFRKEPPPPAGFPGPERKKGRAAWALKAAYVSALCLLGAALAPLSVPMLSPQATAGYNDAAGYSKLVRWDTVPFTGLPTCFAGRLGWEELAQAVSMAYGALPEGDREDCSVYCSLYGAVGAMDYHGHKYGLPRAVSADLGAYYWGSGGMDGKCVIFVNMGSGSYWDLQKYFEDVQLIPASAGVPYSTLSLVDRSIFVCRGLKISAEEFWKAMRGVT